VPTVCIIDEINAYYS